MQSGHDKINTKQFLLERIAVKCRKGLEHAIRRQSINTGKSWGVIILIALVSTVVSARTLQNKSETQSTLKGISKDVVDSIEAKANKKFEPLWFYHWKDSIIDTTNYGHLDSLSHGIVIKGVDKTPATEIFKKYTPEVREGGNYIYLTHMRLDQGGSIVYDLAIVEAETQFDVVKRANTHSLNYDIKNEDIIRKLKSWDSEVGLEIIVVDKDRVEAMIQRPPKDYEKFADEIYRFCPAVVDSKYGTLAEMILDYKKNNYFWLWWD